MADQKLSDRLAHAWNAFMNRDPTERYRIPTMGYNTVSSYTRPDIHYSHYNNERSIVASIYNRIATDVSMIDFRHVMVNEQGIYYKDIDSELDRRLQLSPNKDQTPTEFFRELVDVMFDKGVCAVIPIDYDTDPTDTDSFSILSWRVGEIVQWSPDIVKVNVYNDRTGKREDIYCNKSKIAIIQNPYYKVMNQNGSVVKRLIRKLNLIDKIDDMHGSNKLNIIVQLPYNVRSSIRTKEAEMRINNINDQLKNNDFGIAYTGTDEKIVQLNRPLDNTVQGQVDSLTELLFAQLYITKSILDGSATPEVLNNYYSRTIKPIVKAIRDEFTRKFISKNQYTRGYRVMFNRNPFELVPVTTLADIADRFTRNEILTPNEVRSLVGFMPAEDPSADELRNRNIAAPGSNITPEILAELDEQGLLNNEALDEQYGEQDETEEEY